MIQNHKNTTYETEIICDVTGLFDNGVGFNIDCKNIVTPLEIH